MANIVWQVERLRAEKARTHKFRREKVDYIDTNESDQEFDIAYEDVEDDEVIFSEIKHGPPYTCKLLRQSDGRNHVETLNDKYTPEIYMFDVTKCDEIFDLLVADGQEVVPNGLKIPPLKALVFDETWVMNVRSSKSSNICWGEKISNFKRSGFLNGNVGDKWLSTWKKCWSWSQAFSSFLIMYK